MSAAERDVSKATVNPAHGTIVVTPGARDADTDLPTRHLLAPWPADGMVETIATEALSGMGWTVTGGASFTGDSGDPDAVFVLDVVPGAETPPA